MKTVQLKYGEGFELESGRTFSANCHIIGICPELEISEGYDGGLEWEDHDEGGKLTPAERKEIAEYMIELWQRWQDLE